MRRILLTILVLVAALVVSVSTATAENGITANTVTIGATFPLTGPASGYAPIAGGMKAYFSYINARRGTDGKRGVGGRQVVFKYYDDGYNPANTVQLTRKLVESDKVFAIVGQLGTEVCLSVRPYLNQAKVPQIFVSTGATQFGTQGSQYPWTIGWQPDYVSEGRVYGQNIAKSQADQKIGVLYQNDDYGKDYLAGFKTGLGSATANIISEQPFEVTAADVKSQVAKLKASGATIFAIFATPKFTIQSFAFAKAFGWKPVQIYVNSVSATDAFMTTASKAAGADTVNGSVSVTYLKDPANPKWDADSAMVRYNTIMKKYLPGANAKDQLYLYGFAKAEAFVQALTKAGKSPTRASLLKAVSSMNSANPFAQPGVIQKTGVGDRFVISQQRLIRYTNGTWAEIGPLVDGRK
jgi:branched-chain amino acid transport system substrate-binding protein